jgi:CRISPR-associated protein Cas6
MRLYNAEWEAVREFAHGSTMRDLQFDLVGLELAGDHGQLLHDEIARHLPWLPTCAGAGILAIHGADSGHGSLMISRRTRLWLRLPLDRAEEARALVGKELALGYAPIRIGAMQIKPLSPFGYQYSPFVDLGTADEQGFMIAAQRELDALSIRCGMIPGKARKMHTSQGEVSGYSLMLHDLSLGDSVRLQEQGMGGHRLMGCGLFVPHKSIKEVAVD